MNPLDLPTDARPREKLLMRGPSALADAELVALLLRTGHAGRPVLGLAQDLLRATGGVAGLLHAGQDTLAGIKGLGPAKRAELAAVRELARRALAEPMTVRPVFQTPKDVKDYARLQLCGLGHEVFAVMFLDAQHRLVRWEEVFRGTLAQTAVYPRELVRRSLALGASAVVLLHNHPSGVAEPSIADGHLTRAISAALALVDVRVIDHLVVGSSEVVSFAERGLI
ncbi:DNA repair protein RadC [Piscinibacter sakaiensis]|uniref:DNA repair protein RadC n=1 Tax=Piscinibacter sakaiensis TaxID=1547922 RepID=A0A0K8P5Z2_PISS1|nr:DNA repair protein RadC [Piscinibacter sakaiensis]GAP38032.1 DNA repair protein RadC [Piscinibacter sakaiensis]